MVVDFESRLCWGAFDSHLGCMQQKVDVWDILIKGILAGLIGVEILIVAAVIIVLLENP